MMNHKLLVFTLCAMLLCSAFVRADGDDDGNEFTRAFKRIGKALEKVGQQVRDDGVITDWVRKKLDLDQPQPNA